MSNEAAQARCWRSARPGRCCCPAPCPQYTNRLRCLRASERAVPAMPGAPTDPCTGRHTVTGLPFNTMGSVLSAAWPSTCSRSLDNSAGVLAVSWLADKLPSQRPCATKIAYWGSIVCCRCKCHAMCEAHLVYLSAMLAGYLVTCQPACCRKKSWKVPWVCGRSPEGFSMYTASRASTARDSAAAAESSLPAVGVRFRSAVAYAAASEGERNTLHACSPSSTTLLPA